ncbi:MAG TPA: hypothetical protein VFL29_09660 [Candidatus Dormibacteraeota bacterium]|nr:hypothetical protein [Candidatus Dormibacteraeota bacterium]
MAKKAGGERHTGVLIRGASGDLWFLRDDHDKPVKLKPELARKLTPLLKQHQRQHLAFELPPEVLEALEDVFGPLWWCLALFTAGRQLPR